MWHQGAREAKVESVAFKRKTLQQLEFHLVQRKMAVVIGDQLIQSVVITAGFSHGTILGPTNFTCFIINLLAVTRSEVEMFIIRRRSVPFATPHDLDNIQARVKCG
eukprot:g31336.t1